jgi:hypothetical protein
VLHPRHKLEYFKEAGWETSWIETAEELVRDRFDRDYDTIEVTEQVDMTYSSETEDSMLLVSGLVIFVFLSLHSTVI